MILTKLFDCKTIYKKEKVEIDYYHIIHNGDDRYHIAHNELACFSIFGN